MRFFGPSAAREYVLDTLRVPTALDAPWRMADCACRRYTFVADGAALRRTLAALNVGRVSAGPVYAGAPAAALVCTLRGPRAAAYAHRAGCVPNTDAYAWRCQAAEPLEIEFRCDLDAKDLDACPAARLPAARSCGCCGNALCSACWRVLRAGVVCVDAALSFVGAPAGSTALFYSGNRGMHVYADRDTDGGWAGAPAPEPWRAPDTLAWAGTAPAQNARVRRVLERRHRPWLRELFAPSPDRVATLVARAAESYGDGLGVPATLEECIVRCAVVPQFFAPWYAFGAHRRAALAALAGADTLLALAPGAPRAVCRAARDAAARLAAADAAAARAPPVGSRAALLFGASRADADAATAAAEAAADELFDAARRAVEDSDGASTDAQLVLAAAAATLCARLDRDVSDVPNHPLKVPMAAHPATGRVAVPVRRGDLAAFDPFAADADRAVPRLLHAATPGAAPSFSAPSAFGAACALFDAVAAGREW